MAQLITTLGAKSADELGMILPHEHIFVDLRTWDKPGYAQAEASDVVALMRPEIEKIKAQGVTALVECSAVGVGRRADFDKAVSAASAFPVVVPTGVYREPWIPPWVQEANEGALEEWMAGELTGEIEHSGVQAGWIKVSAGDDGITATETKVLRAAARAASRVNAVIGSHTIRGRVVKDQLDIIEAAGYTPDRYIWIHTQAEPDFDLHLEMARRGAWIEYDSIGSREDEWFIEHILRVLEAGLGNHLLLSHDRGWYDPAAPGRDLKPYTHLCEVFLPKLQAHGVDQVTIRQLTQVNPFRAFGRD
ncbi:MAG: esterase [Anaerolineae bacterium]|nr:esterase [Anaerolineae bacterium]